MWAMHSTQNINKIIIFNKGTTKQIKVKLKWNQIMFGTLAAQTSGYRRKFLSQHGNIARKAEKNYSSDTKNFEVVMVRHGQSEWNLKNLFCGWVDVDLSERGKSEAVSAGKALKEAGYKFDLAYTSVLKRAQQTLAAILKQLGQENIPICKTWRLNERHYGGLTGLNKADTVKKFGEKQVAIWRRSFGTPPPPITPENPYYDQILNDPIYNDGPEKNEFPMFESLELTIKRTLPYWNETIVPQIQAGKKILIAAHGNSLRGIVKTLDQISNEGIMTLNLPTGIPFKYILDANMKPVPGGSLQFMGDPETVRKAMEEVANQGKAKK